MFHKKEQEKMDDYQEIRQVEVVPIVIGALGVVTKRIGN